MRRANNRHQGAPWGLRLKFEPPRAARFRTKNLIVQYHIILQYNMEASARRVRHQVFRGRKLQQENFKFQFRIPVWALILLFSD